MRTGVLIIFFLLLKCSLIGDTLSAALVDTSKLMLVKPSADLENKIFSDSKLNYPIKSNTGENIIQRFLEWLSDFLFGDPGYENVDLTRKIIIWTIIVIFVLVLIRFLRRSEMVSLIRAGSKNASFHFSDITENINEIDFDSRIKKAVDSLNFREAIRWNYLHVLSLLDKSARISFSPYKTNIEYFREINEKQLQDQFSDLSRIYEYVWYGKFETDKASFAGQQNSFNAFKNKLNA